MTRLLVVEHDADAPAGLLGGWAAAGGLAVSTVRLHAGDPLPPAGACDAAVVLGSEQTAYDDAVPWLADELAFVDRLLAGEVPVLGICFGAQLLARRSEEHTSELQSLRHLVCRLLPEKKNR